MDLGECMVWLNSVSLVASGILVAVTAALKIAGPNDGDNAHAFSIFAEAVLWFLFAVAFYAPWKTYCIEWTKVTGRTIASRVVEHLLVPAIVVALLLDSRLTEELHAQITMKLLVIGLFMSLMDLDGSIRGMVSRLFPEPNETNRRFCYLQYPPKMRSDLLPMDFLLYGLTAMLFIRKLT